MKTAKGTITGINGNLITTKVQGSIMQNEVGYIINGSERIKSEIIRITKDTAFLQVYENTKGLKIGDTIEFSGKMLSVQLGPGLLGKIFDGLQNPLPPIADNFGYFLPRGVSIEALDSDKLWAFTPTPKPGDTVQAGSYLGYVSEGTIKHKIMVPFYLKGEHIVEKIVAAGKYTINEDIAHLKDENDKIHKIKMVFDCPVKTTVSAYKEKLMPIKPLVTQVRIVDTFFPVAKGGTFCIPGPFGAGKTVLQQIISRYADVDVVVIAACGERAGEVVETLREFPELPDPHTGGSLMDRTIIIVNTSSMPVSAREASVYTAAALSEYYRQMGLNVLLLADSTSRWAQAMREVSGRLEEIPGEEAFPAYLESRIAEFYERAGLIENHNGEQGSLTIGGTVSPAGGNFEEPVTQATLKVVGAFLGLSKERADARRFPAIEPLESWSKYNSFIPLSQIKYSKGILKKGVDIQQMMMVVGEEGTSMEDFMLHLKAEFLDSVYLQQNAFNKVDAASLPERQQRMFDAVHLVLNAKFNYTDKDQARHFFYELRQLFIDWNRIESTTEEFERQEGQIEQKIRENLK